MPLPQDQVESIKPVHGSGATQEPGADALALCKLHHGIELKSLDFVPSDPPANKQGAPQVRRLAGKVQAMWGKGKIDLDGIEVVQGTLQSSLLWWKASDGTPIPVGELFPPFVRKFPGVLNQNSFLISMLALRDARFVLGGYDLGWFPEIDCPSDVMELIASGLLPERMPEWPGLHFKGHLALQAANPLPAGSSSFLDRIFQASVEVSGSIWADEQEKEMSVSIEWNRGKAESFDLRQGTDWNLTLNYFGVEGWFANGAGSLNRMQVAGVLTLAGHKCPVQAAVDFTTKTLEFSVTPEWVIDLAWIKRFAGEREFTQGAAKVLDSNTAGDKRLIDAGTSFALQRIAAKISWGSGLSVQHIAISVGTPKLGNKQTAWNVLGGQLVANVTAFWNNPPKGKSNFACSIDGIWTWEQVKFSAQLDTRSGEFLARLEFSQDKLKDFTAKKLFPRMNAEAEKKPVNEATLNLELADNETLKLNAAEIEKKKKEILERTKELRKPFEIVFFEIAGNYNDKTIEAQLQTVGFLGFTLVEGRTAADKVEVRIGNLQCACRYDQSGTDNAEWGVQVSGTFGLLKAGRAQVLGGGARVEGRFGSKPTALSLEIDEFNIGELIGMLTGGAPPEVFQNVLLKDIRLSYVEGVSLTFSTTSNIKLFNSIALKELNIEIAATQKKPEGLPAEPAPQASQEPPKSKGSAKIDFGKKLSIDLSVTFEEKQVVFKGEAKKVDVSDLVTGFFTPSKPVQTQGGKVPESGGITAEKIEVTFTSKRDKKKSESAPETDGDLKAGSSLRVVIDLARGKSTLKLLLVAIGFQETKNAGKSVSWRVVFAGEVGVNVAELPLVGEMLGGKSELSFGLNMLYLKSTQDQKTIDAKVAEELFKAGKLDDPWTEEKTETKDGKTETKKIPGKDVKEGFAFKPKLPQSAGTINLGKQPAQPATPAAPSTPAKQGDVANLAQGSPSKLAGAELEWMDADLRLGPVQLSRVGYGLKQQGDTRTGIVALDGALDLGVLRLAVIGLGVEIDVPSFRVTPRLEGLAIHVRNGPIEISGSLLYRNGVYTGTAQVRTPAFTLGAIGRFSMQDGRPSFFLYCFCQKTLGGPPIFFVEGLAGGMGYDTRLRMPETEQVPDFALVKAAKDGLGVPEKTIATFDRDILHAPNNLWFAAGVVFTSFKMLKSVVVIALSVGENITIDIFGVCEFRVPVALAGRESPIVLARIDLAIRGRFSPSTGEVWVRGVIMPGSFLFDKCIQVRGGFAFQAWFLGQFRGDFAITVGGYHPKFQRPAHYFDVPRFAIEGRLADNLVVKGEAYVAITSRAIMAGGRLELLYQSGSVRASFVAEAHFLIAWGPLQYMADIRVAVDASFSLRVWKFTKSFNVHIGALLTLEGPPLRGHAVLELGPIQVRVRFGKQEPAPALGWPEFQQQFLPPSREVITLRPRFLDEQTGQALTVNETAGKVITRWRVTPGQPWELSIETAVPATSCVVHQQEMSATVEVKRTLGVAPMRTLISSSKLTIGPAPGETWERLLDGLMLDPTSTAIAAALAPALWSDNPPGHSAGDDDPRLAPPKTREQVLSGVLLRSKPMQTMRSGSDLTADVGPSKQMTLRVVKDITWQEGGSIDRNRIYRRAKVSK